MGVDFDHEGVRDNMKAFVWEPSLVKINAIQAATEACCLVLSVDETISELPRSLSFSSLPRLMSGLAKKENLMRRSCSYLSLAENEESEKPQAPTRGLPPGAAQRAMRGRGRGMPRR